MAALKNDPQVIEIVQAAVGKAVAAANKLSNKTIKGLAVEGADPKALKQFKAAAVAALSGGGAEA